MSRSRRHKPIRGFTTSDSEKEDKRLARKRLRAALRQMPADEDAFEPLKREKSNVWCFDKDGKYWWGAGIDPKDMRK